jgi:hypothetical protein
LASMMLSPVSMEGQPMTMCRLRCCGQPTCTDTAVQH